MIEEDRAVKVIYDAVSRAMDGEGGFEQALDYGEAEAGHKEAVMWFIRFLVNDKQYGAAVAYLIMHLASLPDYQLER